MVTLNVIKDSIINAINKTYTDITKYTEMVPQNFATPSFFIKLLYAKLVNEYANTYRYSMDFEILYYPMADNNSVNTSKNREMADVADELLYLLEIIDVVDLSANSRKWRGVNFKYEINNQILRFYVSYNILVIRENYDAFMASLEQNNNLKEIQ